MSPPAPPHSPKRTPDDVVPADDAGGAGRRRPRRRLLAHRLSLSRATSMIVEIDDLGDPRLADFSHRTDVDLRRAQGTEHGLYLAESLLVLERALRAGHEPRSVLALGTSVDDVLAVLGEGRHHVPVFTGRGDLLAELTGYLLHRGVVASMRRPALPDPRILIAGARRLVVLEDVADPTNVGAIFRSVAGIGADAVLVTPRCSDPFYRRAIRVSMGTVLQVPWTRAPGWDALAPLLHEA